VGQIHNELRRGPFSAAMTAAIGDTRGGGIERFGETLTPVLNLWDRPEWAYLRKEILFSDFLSSNALAGEFSAAAWSLPVNSKALMIVEAVTARSGAASVFLGSNLRSVIAGTLALGGGSVINRDQRVQDRPDVTPIRVIEIERWTGTDIGNTLGGNAEEVMTTAAAYSRFISPPWVIRPGGAIYVIGQTVNNSVQANIAGYYRQALNGELRGS